MKKIIFILVLASICSCTLDQEIYDGSGSDKPMVVQEAIQIMKEHGFDMNSIQFDGNYIILDGDIMVNANNIVKNYQLEKELSVTKQNIKRKHTWEGGRVSDRYIRGITISLAPDMQADWKLALDLAIYRINRVNECKVSYRYVSSFFADTRISYKDLGPDILGRGEYPQKTFKDYRFYRRPGGTIYINPVTVNHALEAKVDLLLHEIGHTIGFEHTFSDAAHMSSYRSNGGSFDGEQILGTAQYDPLSIMVPGSHASQGNLSENDKKAMKRVYPGPFVSDFPVNVNGPRFATTREYVSFSTSTRGSGFVYLWEVKYARSYSWIRLGSGTSVSFRIPESATPTGMDSMYVRCTIIKPNEDQGREQTVVRVEGRPTDPVFDPR